MSVHPQIKTPIFFIMHYSRFDTPCKFALVREADDRDYYCIPYSNLKQFYSTGGFNEIKPSEAPGFLHDRYKQYQARGLDVVIMRRRWVSKLE